MNFKIYKTSLAAALLATSLTGCYEDKGNYDYSETEEITVTFGTENDEAITYPSISAMRNVEYLELTPKVVSSLAGEIDETNPDYEFGCKIAYSPVDGQRWSDINPDKTKDVKCLATMPAGDYRLWYTVKNKKTGVQQNFMGMAKIIISTYEGWMVLSNNGSDNRARLDIIFTDSKGDERVASDLFEEKTPEIYNAVELVMNPTRTTAGDQIFLLSESGGYKLDETYLQTSLADNIKVFDFMVTNSPGEVVAWRGIYNNYGGGPQSRVCVTTENNAYAVHVFGANSGFEYPLNTDKVGNEPTYKVATVIGTSQDRPGISNCALFYDITNKRFMGFDFSLEGAQGRVLFNLNDPANRLFSFQTGMDLVDMESTKFSQGLVYSVLQDNRGKRHIYAINMSGAKINNCFIQENAYDNINATDFNTATDYAFHSQFPLMFYCKKNKVYCYNLGTGRTTDYLTLDSSETITKIKFNLFNAYPEWMVADPLEQYNLIVASTTGETDGGRVRFYDVSTSGKLSLIKEFTSGLGERIVDVTYRERKL